MIKGIDYKIVASGTLIGSFVDKLISLIKIELGIISSLWIILCYKPKMIISFGGYVSFPVMVAAILLRVPLLVHEQNAVLGKANRVLLRWISALSISFTKTTGINKINKEKVYVTPSPVKAAILKVGRAKYPDLKQKIRILILGGSQGARILSKIVPAAIFNLDVKIRNKIEVFQQCRTEDIAAVTNAYKLHGIKATIASFFDDVPTKLSVAHLVICRAGASTVTEIIAAHRPAIFVPLAIAADNHQYFNAQNVNVPKPSSWIIEEKNLTIQKLSTLLTELMKKPNLLLQAHNNSKLNSKTCTQVDSGDGLLNLVERLTKTL